MSNKLNCTKCNSLLKLQIGYTGADWDCKAGEGSGFGFELSLVCINDKCAKVYTLGHLKEEYHFSEVNDELKCTL
ncbi:hypothetical protein [Bacillus pacificus]|uniref:hypothetical protein n=1 Tax=Bacillus pacificus TaxID=2026187 RepID=UPI001D0E65BC|nr:hypothetical protein [Bacillus pacificus]MCC2351983.1 hypothetical protein [Bacillus pacificus]MCU5247330.1 hypothetical protein [Bacillus pacificus]MCU5467431.1 hypothetical protein [Bacillus pacificus]